MQVAFCGLKRRTQKSMLFCPEPVFGPKTDVFGQKRGVLKKDPFGAIWVVLIQRQGDRRPMYAGFFTWTPPGGVCIWARIWHIWLFWPFWPNWAKCQNWHFCGVSKKQRFLKTSKMCLFWRFVFQVCHFNDKRKVYIRKKRQKSYQNVLNQISNISKYLKLNFKHTAQHTKILQIKFQYTFNLH